MLTSIEDFGFSHDVEQDDGERESFETVNVKLATQRTLKFFQTKRFEKASQRVSKLIRSITL